MDQGSTMKRSAVHNFAPTVTKFCVMWEGQALPHDTKFGNSRCEIVGRRVIFIWSLIHGLRWSGLIKAEPGRPDKWFDTHYPRNLSYHRLANKRSTHTEWHRFICWCIILPMTPHQCVSYCFVHTHTYFINHFIMRHSQHHWLTL